MPALSWQDLQDIFTALNEPEYTGNAFQCFVETGTGLGQTVLPMSDHFEELHTIEIKEEFFMASGLLAGTGKQPIHFYHGPSEEVLPTSILPYLKRPAVFFLDAHWSGDGTGQGSKDVPLLEELRALDAIFPHKALLVLDDLRLFEGDGQVRCEVDWSGISVEAVLACVRPTRVVKTFSLGDRYVLALRAAAPCHYERTKVVAIASPLSGNNGGVHGQRPKSPERPRPDTQTFDFDDLEEFVEPSTKSSGGVGIGSGDAIRDRNTIDGSWHKPWVSTPGAPLDREAVLKLAEQGGDYLQMANRIFQRYSMGQANKTMCP